MCDDQNGQKRGLFPISILLNDANPLKLEKIISHEFFFVGGFSRESEMASIMGIIITQSFVKVVWISDHNNRLARELELIGVKAEFEFTLK